MLSPNRVERLGVVGLAIAITFILTSCTTKDSSSGESGGKSGSKPGTETAKNAPAEDIQLGDLTRASYEGNLARVLDLIRSGANVNERVGLTGNEITPLMAALVAGHREIAKQLMAKGADRKVRFHDYDLETLERHACARNSALCWEGSSK